MRSPAITDDRTWAAKLGVCDAAIALYRQSDVIDLHLDSFIWNRVFGYKLDSAHRDGVALGRHFFGHVDFPRAIESGLTGGCWVITTNPFRTARSRRRAFESNLGSLKKELANYEGVRHVCTAREYWDARAAGEHGAFIGIQGGNALDEDLGALDTIADGSVLRVTLVHFTRSKLGTSSAPGFNVFARHRLTSFGQDYVRRLNELKIFVDLAHISRPAFWDVVEVHDTSQPLLVTHTGVCGVHDMWRNVTDDQLRAVADTGGTVGVMFQVSFLGPPGVNVSTVVDHLAHIVDTVGEDHASIGSDYDGAITPPKDLASPYDFPRLVQEMLNRGWSDTRIKKILGGNVLRVVEALRG